MTGTDLRDELERIAARAPVVDVPPDTYARGRRARTRQTLLTVAASVVAIALVAGLVSGVVGRADGPLPADATPELGVPGTIWEIPDGSLLGPATSDLAIGRGAAAQLTLTGDPVVVGADGVHHRLDLPGFSSPEHTAEISPDGWSLAWGWAERGSARDRTYGIRIADLVTGETREITIGTARRPFVYAFTWSPDSSWLVWEGAGVSGRVGPDSTTSAPVPHPGDLNDLSYSVDDDGLVLIATRRSLELWDGSRVSREQRRGWFAAVTTPSDGVLLEQIQRDPPGDAFLTLHRRLLDGEVVDDPVAALSGRSFFGELGWLEEDVVLLNTYDPDSDASRLELVDLSDPLATTATVVGEVDGDLTSVAVDLMTAERPTVEREPPSWAVEDPESLVDRLGGTTGLLLAGGGFLLGLVVLSWWRRRGQE